jgi:hypothetical protein
MLKVVVSHTADDGTLYFLFFSAPLLGAAEKYVHFSAAPRMIVSVAAFCHIMTNCVVHQRPFLSVTGMAKEDAYRKLHAAWKANEVDTIR